MKIVKGFFLGLLSGLGVGVAISLLVLIWPVIGCTWDLACGFLTCDIDCLDKAGRHFGSGNVANNFNYGATFIFSIIVCTIIGVIWGIAVTGREISEAKAAKREADDKARRERETKNKAEISALLNQVNSFVAKQSVIINDGLSFQAYTNSNSIKSELQLLSQNEKYVRKHVDDLEAESNAAGGK